MLIACRGRRELDARDASTTAAAMLLLLMMANILAPPVYTLVLLVLVLGATWSTKPRMTLVSPRRALATRRPPAAAPALSPALNEPQTEGATLAHIPRPTHACRLAMARHGLASDA